ncbi:nitroreductase family protein [Bifidobacterium sp. 82T10]|uniref:Nitroreductase family protein n=1 Tax=Bifidobacterium miconis TaxID=2834435 RepID=A0ABS6WDE8_9BIFI|nr:nitroreductase family protein [Bifidobacterium miconis]MBW3091720.1 nitroreductase family protein [Bifidobacterium miconis]
MIRKVLDFRWDVMEKRRLMAESRSQSNRFNRFYSRTYSVGTGQVETRILFHTHQIEKGLSHKDFRPGFGKDALRCLAIALEQLRGDDPRYEGNEVYRMALSALHEYVRRHQTLKFDLSYMQSMFSNELWDEVLSCEDKAAGSETILRESKLANEQDTFARIAHGRYAVREYSSHPVSSEELLKAVALSMKTPSVCNRQPTRVHIVLDKTVIQRLLDIQGGYRGYPTPPALVLVSSDLRAFMNHTERNEPYVDGGLFAMSLLYSLEYYGLAACPLNAMFDKAKETATRPLIGLPDYEVPVMYIAVGHFAEESTVCRSARFSAERITTVIK